MIAAIENAILEQLRDAGENGVLGYKFVNLDSFPDEFEEFLKANLNLRTPSGWVAFLGMDQGDSGDDVTGWNARLRFALVVAAKNLRNNDVLRRHGDGAEAGSYQLAVDSIRLLDGSDLGLDLALPIAINGARLVSRSEAMKKQGLSLMAIELECRAGFGVFDEELGEFRTLHVDWDVPPFGNVAAPLPADNPDAEDLIEVPQ